MEMILAAAFPCFVRLLPKRRISRNKTSITVDTSVVSSLSEPSPSCTMIQSMISKLLPIGLYFTWILLGSRLGATLFS